MFSVTYAQLNVWLTAFLWPFARIAALVATAPVFGHRSVATRVKIGLAALMTLVVAPVVGPLPQATVFSAPGVWIIVNQILIGAALGLTMQLALMTVELTGTLVGLQMGLGFASFFDPNSNSSAEVIASYLNVVATLTFLALDGHLQVVSALVESFRSVPVAAGMLGASGFRTFAQWGGSIFSAGLLLALPIVVALLISSLSLGILNRAAPQIGIFQIGFSVTLLVGLLLLQLMLPNMIPFFARIVDTAIDEMGRIAAGLR